MRIAFTVPGKPAPQGSKRHVGRGIMIESSKAVGPWRERIALAAHQAMRDANQTIVTDAVAVNLDFVLPRPLSTPKRSTPPAVKRPDIDKLGRACLDALTHVLIADDSQVINLQLTKRLAELDESPRLEVTATW